MLAKEGKKSKKQFELLCQYLDKIVELIAELKVDIMKLKAERK